MPRRPGEPVLRFNQIHPDYSAEETEWLKAIDRFRTQHGRPPTLAEAYRLLLDMGYRKEQQ